MTQKKSLLLGIILLFIAGGVFVFSQFIGPRAVLGASANNKTTLKKSVPTIAKISVTPTPVPTEVPTYAPVYVQPTPTPIDYQNYGWYQHDGQSMQYVNGSWYNTPQQSKPQAQSSTPTSSSTSTSSSACSAGVPDSYCQQNCAGMSSSDCRSKFEEWHAQQDQQELLREQGLL